MLNLSVECTRFERNYSSCTGRISENLCSRSGGAREKKKDRVKVRMVSWVSPHWMLNVSFCRFFFHLTLCMTELRNWCCLFLTLRISLICHSFFPKIKNAIDKPVIVTMAFFSFFLSFFSPKWEVLPKTETLVRTGTFNSWLEIVLWFWFVLIFLCCGWVI
jgi:hypothetical protein